MTSNRSQSKPKGVPARGSAPQVVVRAGKHYVCSACGTLVEIPADVVGLLVLAVEPESQVERPQSHTSPPEPTSSGDAAKHSSDANVEINSIPTASTKSRPSRPKRPWQPEKSRFIGEKIDGLVVPTGQQLDRALAWVSFHQKVLDRQGSELHRLKKLLKQQQATQVPPPTLRDVAKKAIVQVSSSQKNHAEEKHAQADLGVAPEAHRPKGREPP